MFPNRAFGMREGFLLPKGGDVTTSFRGTKMSHLPISRINKKCSRDVNIPEVSEDKFLKFPPWFVFKSQILDGRRFFVPYCFQAAPAYD